MVLFECPIVRFDGVFLIYSLVNERYVYCLRELDVPYPFQTLSQSYARPWQKVNRIEIRSNEKLCLLLETLFKHKI